MRALNEQITALIEPSMVAMGLEVVQVKLADGSQRRTLQILLDNPQTGGVKLDEIAKANRTISALMDVEELIKGAYDLEVSSPGIDRPLVKPADYQRYLGFEAKIETSLPMDGRRRFKGRLSAFADDVVSIEVDGQHYEIALGNVQQAKLLLTDELIKSHQEKRAQQKAAEQSASESIGKES